MTASPCGSENEMMTGINDPTTHTSCWRIPKRAKARPCADNGIRRCVIESNDGWATAPHNPTMNASTTWANSVPHTATPARRHRDQPQRAQQELLLAEPLAQPGDQHQPHDRPRARARQHQPVPIQADPVHPAQAERQHERHEPGESAHDAHRRQPQHHLWVRDRLQLHQVLLARQCLPRRAVLAHPCLLIGPRPLRPRRPLITGNRAAATAAPTNTIVARMSTPGEPASL